MTRLLRVHELLSVRLLLRVRVLRRCVVTEATLRGTELTVRFRPDPQVWPA